jgi:catechol 2,3-dioxygenase-like lactoylglutathione lyase family enzyme
MDWRLEVIVIPVSDIDASKAFYGDKVGFTVDVDFSAGESFRIVQLTPPGSGCSIVLKHNPDAAGSLGGLQVVVSDIEAAHRQLVAAGVPVGALHHFVDGAQEPGPHPNRGDYETFLAFDDPDGNSWLLQEVPSRR